MMRDTCIWLTPSSSPISAWVRSRSKRRRSTRRVRGERSRRQPLYCHAILRAGVTVVAAAERVLEHHAWVISPTGRGAQRYRGAAATCLQCFEDLLLAGVKRGGKIGD